MDLIVKGERQTLVNHENIPNGVPHEVSSGSLEEVVFGLRSRGCTDETQVKRREQMVQAVGHVEHRISVLTSSRVRPRGCREAELPETGQQAESMA